MDNYVLTLISFHIFVALIVNIPQQDKITTNWARLFSLAQVIMAVQIVMLLPESKNDDIASILSALNNLCFLGAALVLLDRKILLNRKTRGVDWRYLFSNRFFQVVTAVTVLSIIVKAMDARYGHAGERTQADLVITIISIVVYLVEGWAYYYVLGFFRHKWIRYLPIVIALSSSFYEVIQYLQIKELTYLITFLRFPYFISPIMILLRRMPQPEQEVSGVFEKAISERNFILSQEAGLVEALGLSIAADKVLLLIKRPDFNLIESASIGDKFTHYGWREKQRRANGNTRDGGRDLLADISREERTCLDKVCATGLPVFCKSGDGRETIMLPVIMYGGVIAVLFVRLSKGVKARSIFAEKLKLSIRTVLPLVQSSRQLAAMRILSDYFTAKLIGVDGAEPSAGGRGELSVTEGLNDILCLMLKTLSPLAIALKPSQHFNSEEPVLWQVDGERFDASERVTFEDKYFGPRLDKKPFGRYVPFPQELKFGRMIMFARKESDSLDRPTIGIHPNIFKTLGALTNNALKTILRRNLTRILAAADKKIREEGGDGRQIAQVMQEAAGYFGVPWVVIALDGCHFFGDDERVALVRRQESRPADDGRIVPLEVTAPDGSRARLITSSTVWAMDYSPNNNGYIRHQIDFWFGVDRADFALDEMWKDIFSQFVQLGTNKIKDTLMNEMVMEIQKKSAEIEQDKAIMALVLLQGSLTHEFNSLVKDHELGIKRLCADIKDSKLEIPEKVRGDLEWLKSSNRKLLALRRSIFRRASVTKIGTTALGRENVRPCNLSEAIEHAKDEYQLQLDNFKIETKVCFPGGNGELLVDAPYSVVYLSISNLLYNSINALGSLTAQPHDKRIEITTTVSGEHISCRIKDTGGGIKEPEKLFELGSGWGLYLTRASLQDINCTIEVIDTGPSGTTFELKFPVGSRA